MKSKFYLLILLAGMLISPNYGVYAQKGKGNGVVEPYTISASALRGPNETEVTVTVASTKPVTFPVPSTLKKLQLKIRNSAGDVVYIKNFQNLPITNDKVVVNVPEPAAHNTLEVLASVKTAATVDAEMLKTQCVVLLRPDLIVYAVNAPSTQQINVPFNIEAAIQETNLQVGATANVGLYVGTTLVGQVPGVAVAAGGLVSVVFTGLSNSTTGPVTYTVTVSGAVPAEYTTSNNSGQATVEFTNPTPEVNQSNYWLNYNLTRNYHYVYSVNDYYNGTPYYYAEQHGDWESIDYSIYTNSSPVTSTGLPVSVDYKIETSDNRVFSGSFTNVAPYYNDYYYSYYSGFDPVNRFYMWSYVSAYGYMQTTINRYLGNYVYFWNYYNNSYWYGSGSYSQSDPLTSFLNEQSLLKVSLVTTYDDYSYGGGAVQPVPALQHYDFSGSWWGYWYYDYYYYTYVTANQQNSYDYTYAYSGGLTDPFMLPKSGQLVNPTLQEAVFGLDKIYQNGQQATIEFHLAQEAPYMLNVVDLQGREALRIVEGTHPAGFQTRQMDVSSLKPGIYAVTLKSANRTETKKVVIN